MRKNEQSWWLMNFPQNQSMFTPCLLMFYSCLLSYRTCEFWWLPLKFTLNSSLAGWWLKHNLVQNRTAKDLMFKHNSFVWIKWPQILDQEHSDPIIPKRSDVSKNPEPRLLNYLCKNTLLAEKTFLCSSWDEASLAEWWVGDGSGLNYMYIYIYIYMILNKMLATNEIAVKMKILVRIKVDAT